MPTTTSETWYLSTDEIIALHARYSTTQDRRIADRILCVLLKAEKHWEHQEIAAFLNVSADTVTDWLRLYLTVGLDRLWTWQHAGSETRLTAAQQAELKAELARQLYHSAKEVSAWVKSHFSIEYSERGMEDLLGRLEFTFHKVRLVPSHADVQAQETFIQEYERTRANLQPQERLYFMDGVHPMHNVQPGYGWALRGQRVCLPSNSGRRRYNILGLYCPLDGQYWDEQTTDSLNAQTVIALGEKVRQAHPASMRHIIYCDNVRYQHAKLVREHFANTNVEFRFLPPYAPNLNLIERLWKFLKAKVLRQYYATFEEFVQAIQDFLSHLDRHADELASLMTERFEILSPVT